MDLMTGAGAHCEEVVRQIQVLQVREIGQGRQRPCIFQFAQFRCCSGIKYHHTFESFLMNTQNASSGKRNRKRQAAPSEVWQQTEAQVTALAVKRSGTLPSKVLLDSVKLPIRRILPISDPGMVPLKSLLSADRMRIKLKLPMRLNVPCDKQRARELFQALSCSRAPLTWMRRPNASEHMGRNHSARVIVNWKPA